MLFKFSKLVKRQKKILNSLNDELTKIKNRLQRYNYNLQND